MGGTKECSWPFAPHCQQYGLEYKCLGKNTAPRDKFRYLLVMCQMALNASYTVDPLVSHSRIPSPSFVYIPPTAFEREKRVEFACTNNVLLLWGGADSVLVTSRTRLSYEQGSMYYACISPRTNSIRVP